ncbi:MAG: hypothetical protein QOH09_4890 [Pseudonocardiales bacterium]|nr:hypothetical protein [Pseudonocardiales bacterium]
MLDRIGAGARASGVVQCSFHRRQIGADRRVGVDLFDGLSQLFDCAGEQAQLDQDANWRYGAFATNLRPGQVQFLDARHRTQAHVEDKMKEVKACGAGRLPSNDYARNSAWLQIAALAVSLLAWLRHIGFEGDLAKAEPKMLRYRMFSAPARLVTHARKKILKIPPGWTRSTDRQRIHALHPA